MYDLIEFTRLLHYALEYSLSISLFIADRIPWPNKLISDDFQFSKKYRSKRGTSKSVRPSKRVQGSQYRFKLVKITFNIQPACYSRDSTYFLQQNNINLALQSLFGVGVAEKGDFVR